MTRRLPEPQPELHPHAEGVRKAHAALTEALDHAFCQRTTGRITVMVDLNEGGIRAVRVGSEGVYKDKS